jgi:hypothetical protein
MPDLNLRVRRCFGPKAQEPRALGMSQAPKLDTSKLHGATRATLSQKLVTSGRLSAALARHEGQQIGRVHSNFELGRVRKEYSALADKFALRHARGGIQSPLVQGPARRNPPEELDLQGCANPPRG